MFHRKNINIIDRITDKINDKIFTANLIKKF
jgi:hypothetical protein